MSEIAKTPEPPCYAVIFFSVFDWEKPFIVILAIFQYINLIFPAIFQ